jgi:peptide/nickel transport system ATP-binding protein
VSPDERLREISGMVPALNDLPPGCAFAPRCVQADAKCRTLVPPFELKQPNHFAACWQA